MDNSLTLYIVGGFLLVNLLLGLWAGRNVKDIRDYAVGNKRWGVGAITMTYLATTFSGCSLMRFLVFFANFGVATMWSTLGVVISGLFRYFFIAPNIRSFSDCISLGDVLNKLYGKNAKIFAGFIGTCVSLLLVGMQIQVLAIICENFLGLEYKSAAIYCALLIGLYTSFGGMRSVTATDIMQFIFLVLGVFFVATYGLNAAGGGKSVINAIPAENLNFFRQDYLSMGISIFILQAIFGIELVDSATFQRVLMTDSKDRLKKIFLFGIIGWITYAIMRFIMASSAITLNPQCSENTILYLINNVVPESVKPIVIIGLFSLVFSSADSFLHGASIAFTYDFLAPFFPKINNKVYYIKFIAFILGLLSILIGLRNFVYLPLSSIFAAITAPTICFPLLVGMAGLQASNKVFWTSVSTGVFSYFLFVSGSCGEFLKNFATVSSALLHMITFLVLGINSGFKWRGKNIDSSTLTMSLKISFRNLIPIFHPINYINKNVNLHKPSYAVFGIFYILIILIPYFSGDIYFCDFEDNIVHIKLISLTLCSLLITHSIWPSPLKKYRPAFWYLTLTYCLPFLSTIMLILSHGAIECTINMAINIMFLLLLVDWASAIGIGIFGTATAIGYYKFFIQIDPSETVFGFETKYLLIYQIIFGTIIGLLFARKKHIRIKSLDENTDFLEELQQNIIETNNMSIAIADDANSTPENINLHPAENLEYLKNAFADKNLMSPEISQKLAELEIFIEAEEKNISPYMVLNADKVDLLKISEKFESFSRACACENTYVSIYSKEKTIKWDSSQMIKCIGKLAQNYYLKMKNFYDEDSDIFLNITLTDEKIKYISAIDPTISREMDAIGIILSENENFYSTLKDKNFEKVMTDPEKIPSTRLKDHKMIDIERTIDAHYGVLQTIEDEESLNYICVLPINVYDIRPITLDLNSPNVKNLSYNWPAAEKLESDFWRKVSSMNAISTDKIEKAIDYIKIYHRHQTRKSGEPYYLHPMSVAMIAIDIAHQDSEIQDFLLNNMGTIILVALLHDILEDTYIKHKNILQNFGAEVLNYIESVTKTNFKQREFLLSNDLAFTKLINQESITICVKIADRIHNLQTIDGHPKVEKRIAVAEETLMFFTRAAKKYGMTELAEKLTSMCNYIIKNGKIEGFKD